VFVCIPLELQGDEVAALLESVDSALVGLASERQAVDGHDTVVDTHTAAQRRRTASRHRLHEYARQLLLLADVTCARDDQQYNRYRVSVSKQKRN
jgi:hypothetical protein